jgi:peptidoglycan-N-acetylglucosamine deacetylase
LGLGSARRSRHAAGGDWVLRYEIRYGIGYFLFLLLLLKPPSVETLFLFTYFILIGLDARVVLLNQLVQLGLNLLIFAFLSRFQLVQRLLLHALETIQRAIALYGVFNDLFDFHARRIERQQDRVLLHFRGKRADALALQHLGDLHDGVAVLGRLDFCGAIDLVEPTCGADGSSELRFRGNRRRDLGDGLRGTARRLGILPRRVGPGGLRANRYEQVVPFLADVGLCRRQFITDGRRVHRFRKTVMSSRVMAQRRLCDERLRGQRRGGKTRIQAQGGDRVGVLDRIIQPMGRAVRVFLWLGAAVPCLTAGQNELLLLSPAKLGRTPLALQGAASRPLSRQSSGAFHWPNGKRVAVSLSFDDARASQMDVGLPVFDRYHAKITFYVNPPNLSQRLDAWKQAAAKGYEIGNHSMTHPCTGNFPWVGKNALEDYTMAMMEHELDEANSETQRLLGVKPTTFAYPCGEKFIGRGTGTQSYVPLVARKFRAGRGFRDEAANNPAFCDLAQVLALQSDGMSFEEMKKAVVAAAETNGWLVFAGHEIGKAGYQTTETPVLEQFLQYATDPANGIWLDTVDAVARYIQAQRGH